MRGEREAECLTAIREHFESIHFFGLSYEDKQSFRNAIFNAQPNKNQSEFPDFVFLDGFIEHFQITSFQTNRKVLRIKEKNLKLTKKQMNSKKK